MTEEVKMRARERMRGFCRVCPRCDGRACAGEVPGMGGAGSGSSFIRNVELLSDIRLSMKILHDVVEPDVSTSLFGRRLEMPILTAPIGGVVYNMTEYLSESDYLRAIVQGSRAAGTLACTGDGELEEIFESAEEVIRSEDGFGIPFIKPWEQELIEERTARIEEMDVPAFGMDVDSAGLITLSALGHSAFPKTAEELADVARCNDIPFIVKGIMSAGEAVTAVEAGVSGIVVSNHGGRVLDSTPATVEVLPGISEAVHGRCTVLVDGGVRSGTDVFKMLALGADAVLVGRPVAIAAIGGGADAVVAELEKFKKELAHTLKMTGTPRLADISDKSLI